MRTGQVRTALRTGMGAFGRAWLPITAVVVAVSVAFLGICLLGLSALSAVASAQRDLLLDSAGRLEATGIALLLVEVGLPILLIAMAATATTLGAVAKLSDDALGGRPLRVWPAMARGVRRTPALLGALALAGFGFLGLVVLTPVFVAAGVVGLVGAPVVALARRRFPHLRWPEPRRSLLRAVPFGVPIAAALRWGLVVPVASLEGNTARPALQRSRRLVGPGWTAAAATLSIVAAFFLLLNAVLDGLQGGGLPDGLVLVAVSVAQVLLVGVPVAVATALFRSIEPRSPDALVLVDPAPYPRPNVRMGSLVVVVGLLASLVPLTAAATTARADSGATFTVNDRGDQPDAVPGDGICGATSGPDLCTLRAAVEEANALTPALTHIEFSVSGTIRFGAPIEVTAPIDIDGAGQRVELSGRAGGDSPPEFQLLRFTSTSQPFEVANLTFTAGVGGPFGGGAIEATAPAAGSVISASTFAGNGSAAPGGAVAVHGGQLSIHNSTFVGNTSDDSGADLYSAGATTILYSTFEGGYGASSSIETTGAATVGSSIVSYTGGPACVGVTLGTANLDRDGTCPGSSRVGTLGSMGDHGGSVDTYSIGHASHAVDHGDPGHCTTIDSVDARGEGRPSGEACDIGAYEYTGAPSNVAVDVTTSPSPSDLGADVDVIATVAATDEPLTGTGTVTFFEGATELDTIDLVDGVATYIASGLEVGPHVFDVAYSGDAFLPPGTGRTTHTVSSPASGVEVTTAPAPSQLGDDVVITGTVTGSGATATLTGSATFSEGATELATVTITDGTASYTATGLSVGMHTFTVSYSGDAVYPASDDFATHVVSVPGTMVAITADPSPSLVGETVELTATVSTDVAVTPTGDVVFRDGEAVLATVALIDGVATHSLDTLTAGVHTLHADYQGDDDFPTARGTVSHSVRAPSEVSLSGAGSTFMGEPATFTASVATAGGLTPDGEISFWDDGVEIHRTVIGDDGTAEHTTADLAVGSHPLTAVYEGDALVLRGESAQLTHLVAKADTALSLVSSPDPSLVGEQVELTATIRVLAPGAGAPMGEVTFLDGSTELGTASLDGSGTAILTTSALALGDHELSATYDGSASFEGSDRTADHSVTAGRTEISLTASANPSRVGDTVTLTASVEAVPPATGTPAGNVRFLDDGALLGEAPLGPSGEASIELSNLGAGTHPVTADYLGSSAYGPSSAAIDQVVERWPARIEVVAAPARAVTGQSVTFVATVTDAGDSGLDPTGSVRFNEFGMTGPVDLAIDPTTGTATITLSAPPGTAGTARSLSAAYSGDDAFAPVGGGVSVPVDPAQVDLVLTADPPDPYYGQPVTVTVTANPVAPADGMPRGDFEIYDHGTRIRGPLERTGTLVVTFNTPGDLGRFTHQLSARFSGRGWIVAQSPTVPVEVRTPPTALRLTADPSPSVVDRGVTLTAAMTVPDGAAPPLGEAIDFDDGTDIIGSAPLRIVTDPEGGSRYEAFLQTSFATIGDHQLRARFRGPDHEPSVSPTITHEVLPRTTTVEAASNGPTTTGQEIVVSVLVRNVFGTTSPTGTVRLFRDGQITADPASLRPSSTGAATATLTVLPLPVGTYTFEAVYEPTGDFAGGEASVAHVVAGFLTEVTVSPHQDSVDWGVPMLVSAEVTVPAGAGPPGPTGAIVISDGEGTECAVSAPGGPCSLQWDAPGSRTLTATYEGDGRFAPARSPTRPIDVTRRPSNVNVTITPNPPITGEDTILRWSVPDAIGGVAHAEIAGSRCDGGTSGTCIGAFPLSAAGTDQRVTVAFDGDTLYRPSSFVGSVTPMGCHRLQLSGIPADEGTLTATTPGNCNEGAGHVEGTSVRLLVDPIANPAFDWVGVDWEGIGFTSGFELGVVVGTGAGRVTDVRATLRRLWKCHTVTWVDSETVPNDIRPIGGALVVADKPNCPVDADNVPVATQDWQRVEGGQRGRFLGGTVIHNYADTFPNFQFYGYRSGGRTMVVDDDLIFQAVFGPVCRDFRVAWRGPGTSVETQTRTNCGNPLTNFEGYTPGTVVTVTARAEPGAHLSHWEGTDDRLGTEGFAYDSTLRARVVEWTATSTIGLEPRGGLAIARFSPCSRITAIPFGTGVADGHVIRSRDGDCPTDPDPLLYRTGGTVRFEAVPDRGVFARWGVSDDSSDTIRLIEVSTDDSLTLHPSFVETLRNCISVEVRVAEGADALVSTSGRGDPFCLAGGLDQGPARELAGTRHGPRGGLVFDGVATSGDPLLGWSFASSWASGGRRGVAGASATPTLPDEGTFTAELSTCVAINPEVMLVFPDGSSEVGGAPEGFIQLANPDIGAPDCPFRDLAWQVGSSTRLAPLDTAAFDFVRWEGDISPSPNRSEILELTFDDRRPELTLRAVFIVRCFQLDVTTNSHRVETRPYPNCQPTTARTPQTTGGSYIAGTDVFLQGTLPSGKRPRGGDRASDDHVWQGWTGDIEGDRYANPTALVVDRDRTVGFRYRQTTFEEDFENTVYDVGDAMAETIRKAGGIAAMVAGDFLMGAGPTGVVGNVLGLLDGVNDLLQAMGVDTGDFDAFVDHAKQTMEWMSSGFACAGVWALDDGSGNFDAGGDDSEERTSTDRAATAQWVAEPAGDLAASTKAYKSSLSAKRAGKVAGKGGDALGALSIGVDIYDIASAGGVNWANNTDAWTDPDVLVQCLEDKMPDYLGVPPAEED